MKKSEWDALRYFKPSEFSCKCGCGAGPSEMLRDFLVRLENAREVAGIPFVISSGFRCAKHNKFVSGVSDSAHTLGLAADILVAGSEARHKILASVIKFFPRVGIDKHFIHVDFDLTKPNPSVFLY